MYSHWLRDSFYVDNENYVIKQVYILKFTKPKRPLTLRKVTFIRSLVLHSTRMLIYPFWIKNTCAYHCVIKSVPMVKIGAEVRLTSVPFRLLSVPFISIPFKPRWQQLQSHCALSSLIPSHLSDILETRAIIKKHEYISNANVRDWEHYIFVSNIFRQWISTRNTFLMTKIWFKDYYFVF